MDAILLAESLYRFLRKERDAQAEHLSAGNAKSYEAYQCAVGKIRAYELIEGFLKKEFKHLDEEDD
jgi:hypothetical protein